jgi:hypothetical protein
VKTPLAAPVSRLRKELTALEINPDRAFESLPDWWEDAAAHPSGLVEIKGFIAKHYGLDLAPDGSLRAHRFPVALFKSRAGTDERDLAAARAMASAVARILAAGTRAPWSGWTSGDAVALRQEILKQRDWVDLGSLIATCWEGGVPVAYLPDLPILGRKMDGMVTFCRGRPVIIITKKPDRAAWVLFVIAHEIGHIALGHLPQVDGETLVDEEVSETNSNDAQEQQANAFALELLTGQADTHYGLGTLVRAPMLALRVQRYGRQHHVDPGHVLLNLAQTSGKLGKSLYALAISALKLIEPENSASRLFRDALRQHLAVDELAAESAEFLQHLGLL